MKFVKFRNKNERLIFQNKTDQANLIFDSINTEFTYHTLNDEILIKRAEIEIKKGNYEKAVIYYFDHFEGGDQALDADTTRREIQQQKLCLLV